MSATTVITALALCWESAFVRVINNLMSFCTLTTKRSNTARKFEKQSSFKGVDLSVCVGRAIWMVCEQIGLPSVKFDLISSGGGSRWTWFRVCARTFLAAPVHTEHTCSIVTMCHNSAFWFSQMAAWVEIGEISNCYLVQNAYSGERSKVQIAHIRVGSYFFKTHYISFFFFFCFCGMTCVDILIRQMWPHVHRLSRVLSY